MRTDLGPSPLALGSSRRAATVTEAGSVAPPDRSAPEQRRKKKKKTHGLSFWTLQRFSGRKSHLPSLLTPFRLALPADGGCYVTVGNNRNSSKMFSTDQSLLEKSFKWTCCVEARPLNTGPSLRRRSMPAFLGQERKHSWTCEIKSKYKSLASHLTWPQVNKSPGNIHASINAYILLQHDILNLLSVPIILSIVINIAVAWSSKTLGNIIHYFLLSNAAEKKLSRFGSQGAYTR